jgi:hypothetical protein
MAAYTTIDDPALSFNPKKYSAGTAPLAITGVGFEPGMTWIKSRTYADNQNLFDQVRGATKILYPSGDFVEDVQAESLKSWESDGFTVGTRNDLNRSGQTFISWNWKAGTTAVPSGGSITPSACSFDADTGFGMYQYTGTGANADIAHGLGIVPEFIICKRITPAESWTCYHKSLGNNAYIILDTNATSGTGSTLWNDTTPTSTLFYLGSGGNTNNSGDEYISYVFAPIRGYSFMGSYIGNGNANGTFIYTGFKPAYFLLKVTDATGNWYVFDNKRDGFNPDTWELYPDDTGVEGANYRVDFLSNGFKFRNASNPVNGTGENMVFLAMAESPFVNSSSVPNTTY